MKINLIFFLARFGKGGAGNSVYRLCKGLDKKKFNIYEGEIRAIIGPNGAGKTTSFYMTVGLIKANCGKIFLYETYITDFPMYKRAKIGIGYRCKPRDWEDYCLTICTE